MPPCFAEAVQAGGAAGEGGRRFRPRWTKPPQAKRASSNHPYRGRRRTACNSEVSPLIPWFTTAVGCPARSPRSRCGRCRTASSETAARSAAPRSNHFDDRLQIGVGPVPAGVAEHQHADVAGSECRPWRRQAVVVLARGSFSAAGFGPPAASDRSSELLAPSRLGVIGPCRCCSTLRSCCRRNHSLRLTRGPYCTQCHPSLE